MEQGRKSVGRTVPASERVYARAMALAVSQRALHAAAHELRMMAGGDAKALRAAYQRCISLAEQRPDLEVAHRAVEVLLTALGQGERRLQVSA